MFTVRALRFFVGMVSLAFLLLSIALGSWVQENGGDPQLYACPFSLLAGAISAGIWALTAHSS